MKYISIFSLLRAAAVVAALAMGTLNAHAAPADIASAPLGTAPAADVLPNLMFILDDSGSMARNYTPDQVNDSNTCKSCASGTCNMVGTNCNAGHPPFYAASFNTQYYNPTVTYKPGVNYLGVSLGNMNASAVKNNPFNAADTDTLDLSQFRDIWWCNTSSASGSDFNDTAKCRRNGTGTGSANPFEWTNNAVGNGYPNATGTASSTFRFGYARDVAAPHYYVISPKEYCTDASLTTCAAATASTGIYTFPAPVRWCRNATDPAAAAPVTGGSPVSCRATVDGTYKYPRFGTFRRYDIVTGNSFPRAASRTDCSGIGASGCTYAEELQNFANWAGYYRTRMLQMKSVSGRVFSGLDDRYRVGFLTINATNADGYLKISKFETSPSTHKQNWFTKFYAQAPDPSTPLREALSRVGRHYAGITTGINSFMPDDPVQFSCQGNYALLTTDGYWNGNGGKRIDNADMGNEDNSTGPFVSRATGTLDATGSVRTVTTPTVTLRQQICVGNANTTFPGDNTPCGCTGSQTRVKQQTRSDNANEAFTAGVSTGTSSNTTYSFQDITACTAPLIVTTVTPTTRVDEQLISGTDNSTFPTINGVTAGRNQAGSCPIGQGRIKQRTTSYDTTVITTAGVAGGPSFSGTAYTFADVGSCIALATTQTVTRVTEVEQWRGRGTSTSPARSQFGTGGNGSTAQTNVDARCSSGLNQRWSRTLVYDQTETQIGTGPVNTTYATVTTTAFSRLNACSNSTPAVQNPNPAVTEGTPVVTVTGGPNPVPAATTVTDGTPSSSNNGGMALTIPLTPNPSAPVTAASFESFGGAANTLADTAMYYYKNDLRPGLTNNVKGPDGSPNFHQHMVTFTLGLGLDGQMVYDPNYETATSGDFYKIKTAATNCTWTTGVCNWPVPAADDPTAIDDLWHAAVNGRGKYFSAKNPASLENGLTTTLNAINLARGAAAAAATSTAFLTPTDNLEFKAEYRTQKWDGQITAQELNAATGVEEDIVWTSAGQLNARTTATTDSRNIYMFSATDTNKLKSFLYSNLDTTTEKPFFSNKCTSPGLPQCLPSDFSTRVTDANNGDNMVNWLRGQRGNELSSDLSTGLYRAREFILGDVVNAQPVFVGPPNQAFVDAVTPDYATFKTAQASRRKTLYVAANDGMLHALNADTGAEMWAYMPKIVMPNLWKLASQTYDNNHIYSVDGTPAVMDVFFPDTLGATTGAWKTILVGGLNGGGRGYYALDITNPDPSVSGGGPKGLWEICSDSTLCAVSDADMGLSFGVPIIAKRHDGRPIAIVTSGYNNVTPGDGGGYLYVLDLATGAVLEKVGTTISSVNQGNSVTPNGFAKIAGTWVNRSQDNSITRVYGGDLLGNMWRFDMSTASTSTSVKRIAQLKDSGLKPQSITTKPEVTRFDAGFNVIYVGTGRLLGSDDLVDPATISLPFAYQQSIYAFKDTDAGPDLGNLRATGANLVEQVMSVVSGSTSRTITNNTVNWSTKNGWYVDLNPGNTSPGERVNLDVSLVRGVLKVAANEPNSQACNDGGSGFRYEFDYRTGSSVASAQNQVVGGQAASSLIVGSVVFQTTTGALKELIRTSTGESLLRDVASGSTSGNGKRVSWRELVR